MLWEGGHILLVGADELGWHGPYELVNDLEPSVGDSVGALGQVLAWLVNTSLSACNGLPVGAVMVAVVSQVRRRDAVR